MPNFALHCDRTSCLTNVWSSTLSRDSQVDVGVFWTDNAQKAVGGAAQMQAKIRAAVVATNAVYAASKLKLRLRLVFMGEFISFVADCNQSPAITSNMHSSCRHQRQRMSKPALHLCRLCQWVRSRQGGPRHGGHADVLCTERRRPHGRGPQGAHPLLTSPCRWHCRCMPASQSCDSQMKGVAAAFTTQKHRVFC